MRKLINKLIAKRRQKLTLALMTLLLSLPLSAAPLQIGIRYPALNIFPQTQLEAVKLAAKDIGEDLVYHQYPSERSLKLANNAELDGDIFRNTSIEEDYQNLVRVDVPLTKRDFWVWVIETQECMENSEALTDLKPIDVYYIKFYKPLIASRSLKGYERVNSQDKILKMLSLGRADYTVHSEAYVEFIIKNSELKLKRCLNEPLFNLSSYLYLNKIKAYLIPDLEQALKKRIKTLKNNELN